MEQQTMTEMLLELREQNQALQRHSRLLLYCTTLLSVLVGIMLITAVLIGPKFSLILDRTYAITKQLEIVTTELAEADLSTMLENVNGLVVESQEAIKAALKQIENIDIKTLNNAIESLNKIIEPLAKLFGR